MKLILLILVAVIVVVLFLASRKPSRSTLSRSLEINAKPEKIYPHIANLRAYNIWNPWAKMDPNQEVTFEGEDGAIGSQMSWKGKKTGEGTMTLKAANGKDEVTFALHFLKPMNALSEAHFHLTPSEGGTKVTWDFSGQNKFISKIMMVFMDFDKMMNQSFDQGLHDLKRIVEG